MSVAAIGHNNPPAPLDYAMLAMGDLSKFLAETPVFHGGEDVAQGGLFVERFRKTLADIEHERDGKVRPLNEQVSTINATYKAVHNTDPKKPGTADKLLIELRRRLTQFAQAEEDRRLQVAEQARLVAEAAEQRARDAEKTEADAKANADVGELTDVGAAIATADATFAEYELAQRNAARAERDVPVRIGSAMGGKAIAMRTVETLVLQNYNRAIKAIGPNDKIRDAILSAARDYRKEFGALPEGVIAEHERKI